MKRLATLLALALVVTVAAAAPLKLAVSRGPVSLLLYVAEARGFFAAEGVQVQLVDCGSGRQGFQLLAEGAVDAATGAELLVVLSGARRDDLAIVATVSSSSTQMKLVARADARWHDAGGLPGSRIGTAAGTSAQYFLDGWLVFNGIDPAQIERPAHAPEALVGALKRREVDAIAILEPIASAARAALGREALVLPSARIYTQHFVIAANRPALARREAEFGRLLAALLRAQRFIAEDRVAAAQLLGARLSIPAEEAAAAMKEHDYRVRLDQSLVTTMESQVRWAGREALLPARERPLNLLKSIEPGLLRAAAPLAIGLVQ